MPDPIHSGQLNSSAPHLVARESRADEEHRLRSERVQTLAGDGPGAGSPVRARAKQAEPTRRQQTVLATVMRPEARRADDLPMPMSCSGWWLLSCSLGPGAQSLLDGCHRRRTVQGQEHQL